MVSTIQDGKKGQKFRVAVEEIGGSNGGYLKRAKKKILSIIVLSLLSCCFIMALHISSFSSFSLLDSFSRESKELVPYESFIAPQCSGIARGTICCDRTSFRSDVCIIKGDIRTDSASSSIFLFTSKVLESQKIKPYTRKWETSVMKNIQELKLVNRYETSSNSQLNLCDVNHNVPAVFFSTGGYTGNLFHEFNDGIIPLFITSQHFNKKVVFVILEFRNWWVIKYGDILSQLSNYPLVNFNGDKRTHCFKEAIVGLKIHSELTIDSSKMLGNKTILDFRNLLDQAYWPRIHSLIQAEEKDSTLVSPSLMSNNSLKIKNRIQETSLKRPKLVIMSRNGSRLILNEDNLVKLAEEIGFFVKVLKPDKTTELAKLYRSLNSSDVMVGVHGAAMTHFLFLKPETVFIQIIPIGIDWAAQTCFGEPVKKMKLKYIGYKIMPKESSLCDEYEEDDPIIQVPESFTRKGWEYTKKIYLERQNVKLDLRRFRKTLSRAFDYSVKRIKLGSLRLFPQ